MPSLKRNLLPPLLLRRIPISLPISGSPQGTMAYGTMKG